MVVVHLVWAEWTIKSSRFEVRGSMFGLGELRTEKNMNPCYVSMTGIFFGIIWNLLLFFFNIACIQFSFSLF